MASALLNDIRSHLQDVQHYKDFRSVHPDYNPQLSARFLQTIFRPEMHAKHMIYVPSTTLQKEWQMEADKWPRKWFQFFRRDERIFIENPEDPYERITTSLSQANLLRWITLDVNRLGKVLELASTAKAPAASSKKKVRLPMKKKIKTEKSKKTLGERKSKVVVSSNKAPSATTTTTKRRKTVREKPRLITDPLDDDIKPKLSSKSRSRQSPTYCTYNTAWMDLKTKNPAYKISIMY